MEQNAVLRKTVAITVIQFWVTADVFRKIDFVLSASLLHLMSLPVSKLCLEFFPSLSQNKVAWGKGYSIRHYVHFSDSCTSCTWGLVSLLLWYLAKLCVICSEPSRITSCVVCSYWYHSGNAKLLSKYIQSLAWFLLYFPLVILQR